LIAQEYEPIHEIEINARFRKLAASGKLPRVVFFLTLNGRSTRQITRLIKAIYNRLHFYYIHIDQVGQRFAYDFESKARKF
jgi:hypothetical protein